MILLRVLLLMGLFAHKVLWELLKAPASSARQHPTTRPRLVVRFFKLLKIGVLVLLIAQTAFLSLLPISRKPRAVRLVGLGLYAAGLATAVTGRLQLGKNWANIEDRAVLPTQSLVTGGIYSYVRHPIYIGDLCLVAGLQLALNSWLFLVVLPGLAVVFRQARAEDAILARAFPRYEDYRARTRMFIPFVL